MMNIVIELQRRQWMPVEHWNNQLLTRYCEDCNIQHMTKQKMTMKPLVSSTRSTMAVAFSCNGEYVASGHLTHEIVIGRLTPCMRYLRTLTGHDRTPWVLTFDPVQPHVLYSGSLAGRVYKWNVQDGERHGCSFNPQIASPINSITFLPSDPNLLLVAVDCFLFLLSATDLSVVWRCQTDSQSRKVRLVIHHPEESRVLTAVTDESLQVHPHFKINTSYKLHLQCFHKSHPLNLQNDRLESLVCSRARIVSPHSCRVEADCVICTVIQPNSTITIDIYSTLTASFGECLYSFHPERGSIVSLDLSPHNGYLLVGFAAQATHIFHMSTSPETSNTIIYRIHRLSNGQLAPSTKDLSGNNSTYKIRMEKVCSVPSQGSNVALWMPLSSGHGYGVCVGTSKGEVTFWRSSQL